MKDKKGIVLLGLGPGDPALLTRQAWELLEQIDEIYLRTGQHPVAKHLPSQLKVHTFDHLYNTYEDFEQVYEKIVEKVISLGKQPQGVVYAVPGHPYVAESTCLEITRKAADANIPLQVIEGVSFIEPVLTALAVDPLPQLTLVDALELAFAHHPSFPPSKPALIAQLHSREMAGELKITLMAVYPDEHPVRLVHAAGTSQCVVEDLPLYQIDQSEHIGLMSALYIPALEGNCSFEDFQELVAHLRAPEGCPWDREQDHQSLRANLLEEAYEAVEAIDADDPEAMQEEFGDLLLQVVLQSQIAAEYGEFMMADVIRDIHTKLVSRHPHVFEDTDLADSEAVIRNWERMKEQERLKKSDMEKGLLDGIPVAMPALLVADNYQRRAARVGFDWPDIEGVIDKLLEEVEEYRQAKSGKQKEEEFGDMLFALVNLARWLDIDPETALRETNAKFRQRFAIIEAAAREKGRHLSELSLEEMEAIWQQSKGN